MNTPGEPAASGDLEAGAKRKQLRRRLFPRGLSFTREGRVYVLTTLGVGFAAVNTGNNLLFLVLGMMLGLIIVSGILSEVALRYVTVKRKLPKRVEARSTFPVELALLNKKTWAASFSVELRDEIDGKPFRRRCFFLRVGPGEKRAIAYRCEIHKRGLATFDGTIVSTRFPFGLFEKTRFISHKETLIVLPERVPVIMPIRAVVPGEGGKQSGRKGAGQDFLELRDMAGEDDPRRIHWRATARTGKFIVRESEQDAKGLVEIVLDAVPSDNSEPALEKVEQNIRIAGSLLRQITAAGLDAVLTTAGPTVLKANSLNGVTALLEHLALLNIEREAGLPAPIGRYSGSILLGSRAMKKLERSA